MGIALQTMIRPTWSLACCSCEVAEAEAQVYVDSDRDLPTARLWRSAASAGCASIRCSSVLNNASESLRATHLKIFDLNLNNVRSLSTEVRIEELIVEASTTEWDVVLVNETWRA